MNFIPSKLSGVELIEPDVHRDHRGFFLESYTKDKFIRGGVSAVFVQDNHSCSRVKGVVRGLHFQRPPCAQSKLIRVTRGAIYDVAVDLRKASPTFGKWQGFDLSAENFRQLFVPAGFAHGFCTTEDDTEVQYKVDNIYSPEADAGIRWDDPAFGIDWPVKKPILSDKDARLPFLKEIVSPF